MSDRYEKEREESIRQRHLHVDRRFGKLEDRDDVRAAARVCSAHPHVSECEALTALANFDMDEKSVINKLQSFEYLMQIRKQVCEKVRPLNEVSDSKPRSTPTSEAKNSRKNGKAAAESPQAESPDKSVDMTGWSEARKVAFSKRRELPNSYSYNYTEPGEEQTHGPWSPEEHELFVKQVAALGGWDALRKPDMKWGTFSLKIPGRVGYQCSNYFIYLQRLKRRHSEDDDKRSGSKVAKTMQTNNPNPEHNSRDTGPHIVWN
eukprot:CAMPEP_0181297164 /NCGR_PEP_ID=MMETSP1101-20121128/5090_1 /TAXON_ID=46948 /ORGANISM="Rhodomonas abbreviata, Strain Caron Lab Isolate" /LENGTH=261 /DNA_ID=CAMNT_0023402075 /DNA_START=84 /DNA_END=867 /DNA_ORIENTATION=-